MHEHGKGGKKTPRKVFSGNIMTGVRAQEQKQEVRMEKEGPEYN